MDVEQVLAALDPQIVARFRTAIELGKWPNGEALTPRQRDICMQAIVAWEFKHLPEQERTGYIPRPKPTLQAGDAHDSGPQHPAAADSDERPLKLV